MKTNKEIENPLIVIVGVTASGKTDLAIKLAHKYNGEIICADSRTIYKEMNIGTAKPSSEERENIIHHMLDIVYPNERFSAAQFQKRVKELITDITNRNKLPILVGGSGLYIDSVIYNFNFLPPGNADERELLESLSVKELQKKVIELGLELPANEKNPRHLIRKIETNGKIPVKKSIRKNTLIIGIEVERDVIRKRIIKRVEAMVNSGLVEEVRQLSKKYSWNDPGMLSTGYKSFRLYIENDINIDQAKELFVTADFQLARRQRVWFKRNPHIVWIKNNNDADEQVKNFLQNI